MHIHSHTLLRALTDSGCRHLQAAKQREEAAKTAMDNHCASVTTTMMETPEDNRDYLLQTLKSPHVLLQPSTHLTAPCWRDFRKWMKTSHPKWDAKKRQASDAEKVASGETRKGKVYFVDVSYKGTLAQLLADAPAASSSSGASAASASSSGAAAASSSAAETSPAAPAAPKASAKASAAKKTPAAADSAPIFKKYVVGGVKSKNPPPASGMPAPKKRKA